MAAFLQPMEKPASDVSRGAGEENETARRVLHGISTPSGVQDRPDLIRVGLAGLVRRVISRCFFMASVLQMN
jgi:hypothetical protein